MHKIWWGGGGGGSIFVDFMVTPAHELTSLTN